jgi:hypothetical protein
VASVVEEAGAMVVELVVVPGWRGASPRGVSTRMRKWPVKGGPSAEGRESASICGGCQSSSSRQDRRPRSTDLVVDEPPLLEEGVYAHDGADVAGEVAPARGDGEVL